MIRAGLCPGFYKRGHYEKIHFMERKRLKGMYGEGL